MTIINPDQFHAMLETPHINASGTDSTLGLILDNSIHSSLTPLSALLKPYLENSIKESFRELVDEEKINEIPDFLKPVKALTGLRNANVHFINEKVTADEDKFQLLYSFIYNLMKDSQKTESNRKGIEKAFEMLGLEIMPWKDVIASTEQLRVLAATPRDLER